MDRARLHAGHCPRFSSRKTRVLQPGRFMGRCAAPGLGVGGTKTLTDQQRRCYFACGLGVGGAGGVFVFGTGGVGTASPFASGDLMLTNSSSKISVEFGPISAERACSP